MRRREFITLVGSAVVLPLAAHAQQPAVPVIGFLSSVSAESLADNVAAFRRGLRESGYIEGQNVAIEYRWAEGRYDRLPALAADLVSHRVNVLVAVGGSGSAAKAATATIAIVSMSGGDPVKEGLVANLNHPGGNLTGVALFAYSLGPKRLELLRELVPNARRIGVLFNPSNVAAEVDIKDVEAAARATAQQILSVGATSERDFDPAFVNFVQNGASALLVMADPFFFSRRDQLVALAARHAIPAIYEWRQIAAAGGLMSYGSNIADAYRQLGVYTAEVLKGANPGDLPFQQAVKVELVINLKTAKALGLTFPITLLGRADDVIE